MAVPAKTITWLVAAVVLLIVTVTLVLGVIGFDVKIHEIVVGLTTKLETGTGAENKTLFNDDVSIHTFEEFVENLIGSLKESKGYVKNKKVNRYTRAGINGKVIQCPLCLSGQIVYHFSWISITCQSCKEMVDKSNWEIG